MKVKFINLFSRRLSHIGGFIISLLLFSGSLQATGWNWHDHFPWVYNDTAQEWQYWRAGTDGQFYLWKDKDKTWYRYDATSSKWISSVWDAYFSSSTSKDDSKDTSSTDSSKDSSKEQTTDTSNSLSLTLSHGGLTREYLLYVPSSYDGNSQFPLLFNFHGYGGTSSSHMYAADMRTLADQKKFLLVYPQGSMDSYGSPHWNSSLPGGDNKSTADDSGFVEAMITSISSSYQVNATRIYACGYSNGGMMSYFLGGSMSDKIAAIGSVSGTMLDGNPDPASPVPMINIHGTADYVIAYTGGDGAGSISSVLTYWAEKNGASSIPAVTNLTSGTSTIVEKSLYSDSSGTPWVEHYKVVGGGHVWLDLDINGSNANDLIWDFFSKHALSGPIITP